jgi:nitrite reductase (NAD(P)H)
MEVEQDRNQTRPVYWAKEPATVDFKGLSRKWSSMAWQPVLPASHFDGADETPNGISATVKRGDTQLAVWRVRGRYYATQQMCPHKRAFVLSDGLVGEDLGAGAEAASANGGASATDAGKCDDASKPDSACGGGQDGAPTQKKPAPWVSCPYHKRNYDLASGDCKNDETLSIATFAVEARPDGLVYLKLPPVEELDAELGTKKWMVKKGESGPGPFEELDKKIEFKNTGHPRVKRATVKPNVGLPMRKPVELMAGGGGCGSAPDW